MSFAFKQAIAQGPVHGTMLSEMYVPNMARIFKVCGFDYAVLDCEHGYFDFTDAANIISVARAVGLTMLVRLSKVDREFVLKYLDMGADGFILSTTGTPEQIAELVDFAKYPPMGHRGISLQRAHTDYNPGKIKEYLSVANEKTVIVAQIESAQGVKNAQAIAAVPGVDGLIIGPNDLALDMGCLGDNDCPAMLDAFHQVIDGAAREGKFSGAMSSNTDFLKKWEAQGMRMMNWNSEVGMLLTEGKRGIKALKG